MATDKWLDGDDLWNSAADWSAGVPTSTTDVTIAQGDPLIDAAVGPVTVNSVDDSAIAQIGGASLSIEHGGSLTTIADFNNSGTVAIDEQSGGQASSLTIGGDLVNSGTIDIGAVQDAEGGSLTVDGTLTNTGSLEFGDPYQSAATTVALGAYAGGGRIEIDGSVSSPIQSKLNLGATAAPGTLNTKITVYGDAVLEYGGGAITAIGARGDLLLYGDASAQITVAGGSGDDSALKLTSNAGVFEVGGGAFYDTGPGVNFSNSGTLETQDAIGGRSGLTFGGDLANTGTIDVLSGGGLTVDGTLSNTGAGTLDIGIYGITTPTTATVGAYAGGGSVAIYGAGPQATLNIESVAPSTLSSTFDLYNDAVLHYGGGAITAIGASGRLLLDGPGAQVRASGGGGNDSGLELSSNAGHFSLEAGAAYATGVGVDFTNSGTLEIDDGSLTIGGNLVNSGAIDDNPVSSGRGGGLTVDGTLTNAGSGALEIFSASMTLGALVNGGEMTLGAHYSACTVAITGAATDEGSITVDPDASLSAASLLVESGATLTIAGGSVSAPVTLEPNGTEVVDSGGTAARTTIAGGLLDLKSGAMTGAAPITFSGPSGTLEIDGFASAAGGSQQQLFNDEISGFGGSDAIAFAKSGLGNYSTITAAEPEAYDAAEQTTAVRLMDGGSVVGTLTLAGDYQADKFTVQTDPGNTGAMFDVLVDPPCYVRGARILTRRGEVAVERLAIGDRVITASGEERPVTWIGRRALDCRRHADPVRVWPIRVSAHAFGEGRPHRDLWLSPGHNIAAHGALMPIKALQNGVSVAQVEVARVEYWHVELDSHDVLLAEGLPAESYLDTGNRTAFVGGGAFIEAHPDFEPKHWAETCLPLVVEGTAVERVKAELLRRLADLGYETTDDADLHLTVDGARIEPAALGPLVYGFVLPWRSERIVLRSRTFVPSHTSADNADPRTLGVCVGRLRIDGREIELDDAVLDAGWDKPEGRAGLAELRWTHGAAALPPARRILVELAEPGLYWREAESSRTRRRANAG